MIFGGLYSFFIASNFKTYGLKKINDDYFLSIIVGNAASISNGLFRVICKIYFIIIRWLFY